MLTEQIVKLISEIITQGGSLAIWIVFIVYCVELLKIAVPWVAGILIAKFLLGTIKTAIIESKRNDTTKSDS